MEENSREFELCKTIYKSLCKVLKDRKMYHKFRYFIGNPKNNIYTYFSFMRDCVNADNLRREPNPFTSVENLKDLTALLSAMMEYSRNGLSRVKEQIFITNVINVLLHHSIECCVSDFKILEDIGRETFNIVGRKLYGEDFKDETETEMPESVKKMIELQNRYLASKERQGMREMTIQQWMESYAERLRSPRYSDAYDNDPRSYDNYDDYDILF